MECEKVRDRFSSLLEGELDPSEEKILRDHLASCSGCQKDFQQFSKTVQWLHSVGEVEVPEGFLGEVYKKMDEGKRRSFLFPASWGLPIQAVGMVAIIFLVLYLTKMMPVETLRMKGVEKKESLTSTPLPVEKEADQILAKKEIKEKGAAVEPSPQSSRLSEIEQHKTPVSKTAPTLSEPKKAETAPVARVPVSVAAKPDQEIVLRISDREKMLVQLHNLLHQFGGNLITEEGNTLLASLPPASFGEFEKELAGLASSEGGYEMMLRKDAKERLDVQERAKGRGVGGKGEEWVALDSGKQDYLVVRILLLQE